jgi:glycosyltransferase involved in cell wall biosynthesis
MSNSPFFSIVIPTYNRSGLILKTLDSVFEQTFNNYEIIVVDNCSTDNTEEVLKPLIHACKIQFIKHDKNYERAVSRNTGMAAASGQFVTLLDSDDIMYPNNLIDAFSFVEKNPEVQLFHNFYELVNENGLSIYQYKFPSLKNPKKAIAKGNFLSCIGVFLSKEIYKKYRFDPAEVLQGIEDWEFWLRVLADHDIGRIEKINSGIVHHKGRSITKYALASYVEKKDYVLRKIKADSKLMDIYRPYLNKFNASCYLLAATMANSANLFGEAKGYLFQALNADQGTLLSLRYLRILQKTFFKIRSKIDNE